MICFQCIFKHSCYSHRTTGDTELGLRQALILFYPPNDIGARSSVKLADTLNSKDNNFNLLRLSAATFVLVYHMYALLGESDRLHWIVSEVLGSAVQIFIIISGFLVTKSWMNDQRPFLFIKKRALRIFPALICSVLLAVLIIGPLVTRATDLKQYFSHPLTTWYLKNVFLYPIYYWLPGVFMENPYPNAVNGSLWTLPIEVFLYGVLVVLGLTRVMGRRILVAVIAVLLIVGEQYFNEDLSAGGTFLTMPGPNLLSLGIFFVLGALYYLFSEKIVLNKWMALLLLVLFISSAKLPMSDLIRYAALPYIVLYFAYVDFASIKFFQQMDVSYGVYVYAFPIQQSVIHYLYSELETYAILILSLAIVLVVSYLSWRFVEKPSLAWAHKRTSVTV